MIKTLALLSTVTAQGAIEIELGDGTSIWIQQDELDGMLTDLTSDEFLDEDSNNN